MAKGKDTDIAPPPPTPGPDPSTGCVVCGQYGDLQEVTKTAGAHAACAESRPDVIAKVKSRQ